MKQHCTDNISLTYEKWTLSYNHMKIKSNIFPKTGWLLNVCEIFNFHKYLESLESVFVLTSSLKLIGIEYRWIFKPLLLALLWIKFRFKVDFAEFYRYENIVFRHLSNSFLRAFSCYLGTFKLELYNFFFFLKNVSKMNVRTYIITSVKCKNYVYLR